MNEREIIQKKNYLENKPKLDKMIGTNLSDEDIRLIEKIKMQRDVKPPFGIVYIIFGQFYLLDKNKKFDYL